MSDNTAEKPEQANEQGVEVKRGAQLLMQL